MIDEANFLTTTDGKSSSLARHLSAAIGFRKFPFHNLVSEFRSVTTGCEPSEFRVVHKLNLLPLAISDSANCERRCLTAPQSSEKFRQVVIEFVIFKTALAFL